MTFPAQPYRIDIASKSVRAMTADASRVRSRRATAGFISAGPCLACSLT